MSQEAGEILARPAVVPRLWRSALSRDALSRERTHEGIAARALYTRLVLGFSSSEFVVFLLVAVVVIGPQRLPEYTRKLTQMVRRLRVFLESTKTQIAEEVGPELADLDLSSLDPRQYDPRKIVRDALGEDLDAIKKDLQSPFKAVKDAAKETTDAIDASVKETRDKDRANSLASKIEEKKAEALAAARAAKEGEAATAELPQVEASQAGPVVGAEEDAEAAIAEEGPDGEARAADVPADSESVNAEGIGIDLSESAAAAEPAPAGPAIADPASSEPAVVEPVAAMTEPVTVPTSLVEEPAAVSASAPSAPCPLSPRDIVRAAKEAARTREAAASALVD